MARELPGLVGTPRGRQADTACVQTAPAVYLASKQIPAELNRWDARHPDVWFGIGFGESKMDSFGSFKIAADE